MRSYSWVIPKLYYEEKPFLFRLMVLRKLTDMDVCVINLPQKKKYIKTKRLVRTRTHPAALKKGARVCRNHQIRHHPCTSPC